MALSRIGSFMMHQSLLRDVTDTQRRLFETQTQISSGFKSQNFAGINGEVENFTALESKMKKSQTYIDNNTLVISRLRQTDIALDQIIETVDDIQDLIVRRRSPSGGISFAQQMEALKKQLASQLNTNAEGRYLFGGTRTDIPPVLDNPVPITHVLGVPDDGYYQGSTEDITIRAQDNFEIQYNVRADDAAFQEVFAGLFRGIQGDGINSDTILKDAQELIDSGLQGIIALRAKVNATTVSLEEINQRHSDLRLYWKGVTENLVKTDLVEASTQVAVDQAVLTASFQAFARISSLRLADFLR